jgi:hypothetical protein
VTSGELGALEKICQSALELEETYAGDEELRRAAESLLKSHGHGTRFTEAPAFGTECFPAQDGIAGLSSSVPVLHQGQVNPFDAVRFETNFYFGFVVSSLNKNENLQIASGLAPAVDKFLASLEI